MPLTAPGSSAESGHGRSLYPRAARQTRFGRNGARREASPRRGRRRTAGDARSKRLVDPPHERQPLRRSEPNGVEEAEQREVAPGHHGLHTLDAQCAQVDEQLR
jgi:hypothetical protein